MMTFLVVGVLWCCSSVALSLLLGPVLARQSPPEEWYPDWVGEPCETGSNSLRRPLRVRIAIARTECTDMWRRAEGVVRAPGFEPGTPAV